MADIAKEQSIKHFEGRAGRNHSVQNAKPKKKSPANPYLQPILPLAGYNLTLVMGEATQLTLPTHPTKPTRMGVLEASDLGGT